MTDFGPNLKLAEKKLSVQKQELTLVIEKFELRNMELDTEIQRNNFEIDATRKKLAQCETDLVDVRSKLRGKPYA